MARRVMKKVLLFGKVRRMERARAARVCRARAIYLTCAEICAREHGVSADLVASRARKGFGSCPAPVAAARREAMYLTATLFDIAQTDVADAAGVAKQYAGRALAKVEDERDDPIVDGRLLRLEAALSPEVAA